MFDISASMRWNMPMKGLSLIVKGEDLCNGNRMRVRSSLSGQNYSFRNNTDSRLVSLTLRYSFNDFKKHSATSFDNSRLGF
jgi:hypothetical protein